MGAGHPYLHHNDRCLHQRLFRTRILRFLQHAVLSPSRGPHIRIHHNHGKERSRGRCEGPADIGRHHHRPHPDHRHGPPLHRGLPHEQHNRRSSPSRMEVGRQRDPDDPRMLHRGTVECRRMGVRRHLWCGVQGAQQGRPQGTDVLRSPLPVHVLRDRLLHVRGPRHIRHQRRRRRDPHPRLPALR